jgi:glycosyltransferase involved in cell wall biosynthesis
VAELAYALAEYPVASQTFVHAELAALRESGVDIEVLVHRRGDPSLRFSPDAAGEPLPTRAVPFDSPALAAALGAHAHVHSHFADVGVRLVGPAAATAGVPWSVTGHAYDLFRKDAAVRADEWRALPAGCRAIVAISRFHRAFLISQGVPADRVVVAPNAARLGGILSTAPPPPTQLRRILAVGRPVAKKGFPHLVNAWLQARMAAPQLTLEIVGGEGLIPQQVPGLSLTPMRPHAEVLRAMAEADLVVAPSVVAPDGDMDGIPTVLVEACALRRPVVASAVAGIGDLVCDGVNGLLVQPGDVDALRLALLRLYTRPAELQRLGAAGPTLAAAHDAGRVVARLRREVFACAS